MRTVNRSLLSATLSLSAVVASVLALAPSAHAQSAPAVTQDPNIVSSPVTANPAGTFNVNALQYFANGATFQGVILRSLTDFYGIASPTTNTPTNPVTDQGKLFTSTSSTPAGVQPASSPRNNTVQYNYCGTGSGNGRATFTGTAQALFGLPATTPCAYVASSTGAAVQVTPSATVPLPQVGTGYTFANYPNFPTGVAVAGSAAPLFAFSTATASASALSATELTTYTTNKATTRGRAAQVPAFFGAITPVFNPAINSGVSPRISNADLCRIYDGRITDYSGLTAPSTTGLSGPLTVIVRSDNSGGTTAFTAYLARECGALVTAGTITATPGFAGYYLTASNGVNLFPTAAPNPSATFLPRAQGDDGVAALVVATAGGAGYVEAVFAQPFIITGPIQAALQSPALATAFLTASVINIRNATTNVSFVPNSPANPCVLTVTGLNVVPTISNAYPIVTQNYGLTYQNYPTTDETNATRGLFSFILGNAAPFPAQNDVLSQSAGFVLLRRGAGSSTAIPVINRLRTVARGCVNNTNNVPTGFSPANGPVGSSVNIIGINFTATSSVAFSNGANGFIASPSVTLNGDGTLTAVVPAGAVTGPIRVGSIQTPNDFVTP
jgi:hypothetical protein